jgi:hypothetical protein
MVPIAVSLGLLERIEDRDGEAVGRAFADPGKDPLIAVLEEFLGILMPERVRDTAKS